MPISTVQAMMPTRKGRFVRVSLNDMAHSMFRMSRMSPNEVRCMDIRVGDTVSFTEREGRTRIICVFLDRREPNAIPFSA